MKKTLFTLKEARTLLSEPTVWTQRAMARDVTSRPCPPTSVAAVQWDLCGAIERAVYGTQDHYMTPEWTLQTDLSEKKQAELYERLRDAQEMQTDIHRMLRFALLPKITTLAKYNDAIERTHEDVIELLDATIKRIEDIYV